MAFDPELKVGDTLDNNGLIDIFKCGPQGGMRRSLSTKTLILTSSHQGNIYEDRWIDSVFHYTGMGLKGDQRINYAQNKTLTESGNNGVAVFLFEVFKPRIYRYCGQVVLAGEPYQEEQPDANGSIRQAWVFPLKTIDSGAIILPQKIIEENIEEKVKKAQRLSDKEIEKRAMVARKKVGTRNISTSTFDRNVYVAEAAKRRANGNCQLCEQPAPFINKAGQPYLETHHINWLADGGEDSIENTVALCPNCHRKMHTLNISADEQKLIRVASPT